MAAQKKPASKPKSGATETGGTAKKAGDPLNEIVETVRGFQMNTLIAVSLAVVLFICLVIPDLRYIWWINIPLAGASGYLFWSQGNVTKGTEQKVCRWGLLIVAVLFLYRDILISQRLAEFDKAYGDLNDLFS